MQPRCKSKSIALLQGTLSFQLNPSCVAQDLLHAPPHCIHAYTGLSESKCRWHSVAPSSEDTLTLSYHVENNTGGTWEIKSRASRLTSLGYHPFKFQPMTAYRQILRVLCYTPWITCIPFSSLMRTQLQWVSFMVAGWVSCIRPGRTHKVSQTPTPEVLSDSLQVWVLKDLFQKMFTRRTQNFKGLKALRVKLHVWILRIHPKLPKLSQHVSLNKVVAFMQPIFQGEAGLVQLPNFVN